MTDFGLAKGVGGEDITSTGDVIGTLRYMAPERFQGEGDARSDTYALGLTLFELLSLRLAFDEQDRNRLILQVTQEDPPRLRKLDRSIPLDLETIVHKAMAREPGQHARRPVRWPRIARFVAGRPILAGRSRRASGCGAGAGATRWWPACWPRSSTVFLAGFLSVTALLVRTNELYEQSENRRADSDGLRIVAERRRADAESLRLESERRRAEANQRRELTRRNLYYAQMRLAQQSWFGMSASIAWPSFWTGGSRATASPICAVGSGITSRANRLTKWSRRRRGISRTNAWHGARMENAWPRRRATASPSRSVMPPTCTKS